MSSDEDGGAATFFAHSTAKADRSDWQPLEEHLQNVAGLAAQRTARFGAAAWGLVFERAVAAASYDQPRIGDGRI